MTARTEDDRDLERFIDGELSFHEQRALLRRLEQWPDGWRRLALGLLEDQAFRSELQPTSAIVPPPAIAAANLPVAALPRRRSWTGRLTAAVLCLFCFVAGTQWNTIRIGENPRAVAVNLPAAPSTSVTATENVLPQEPDSVSAPESTADVAENRIAENSMQQTMKVVFSDWPEDMPPVEVPVVESSSEEADAWLEQSAVPDAIRQQWESAGYLIYEQRKYVPVPLKDGRQGFAPVSEVVVEYLGTENFQ